MKNMAYINVLPDWIPESGSSAWEDISQFGLHHATTFDPDTEKWHHWNDSRGSCLVGYLRSRDLVISYNATFDLEVLSAYGDTDYLGSFSIMNQVQDQLGFRLKLQNLANANNFDGTRQDLVNFLNGFPDMETRIGYNKNKIRSMEQILNKAVTDGYLHYWNVGEDRGLKRLNTTDWIDLLISQRVRF